MRSCKRLLSIAFFASLFAHPASSQELPPVEAYAGHPRYSTAALSPSGDWLALAAPEDGGDSVIAISFADPTNRRAYRFNRSIVNRVFWLDEETLFIEVHGRFSTIPEPSLRSYLASPLTDEEPEFLQYFPLVGDPEAAGGGSFVWSLYDIADVVPGEDGQFLMSAYVSRQPGMQTFAARGPNIWALDLLRAFTSTGQVRPLEQGNEYTGQWFTDGNGGILARVDVLESGRQVIFVPDGTGYREVGSISDNAENDGDIVGLSMDGSAFVVRALRGNRFGLYPVSVADASWGDPIFYDETLDVGSVIHDERTFRVNGFVYEQNGLIRYHYFDPELQSIQETLEGVFPGHSVAIFSLSEDNAKVLFQISSLTRPGALGMFDGEKRTVDTVSERYPDIVGGPLGEASIVDYPTADGTTLHGILTVPPRSSGQGLPLIILEDTAATRTFDVLAHFLAARGYATLRPGVRQVRRFGEVSGMGELNDWILKVQEDYLAGVEKLASDGVVDPTRVCIYGQWEQAYIALMNTVLAPDAFQCAIAAEPLTDLRRLLNWARFASEVSLVTFGSPLVRNYESYSSEDMERLSPVTRAADIDADILLFGYERDDHAPSLANALRSANKNVEYVEFVGDYDEPAEARAENAILTYSEIERFLQEQLGP